MTATTDHNGNRRLGRFDVDEDLIRTNTEQLYGLFGWLKFVPISIRHSFVNGKIEMLGLSPHFDEVPEGCMSWKYDITISESEYGTTTYGVTKATNP